MKQFKITGVFFFILAAFVTIALGESMKTSEKSFEKATFGAGCFWGVEKVFSKEPGVISTQVGYSGGKTKNPSYEQVCTGLTGHVEAVEVTYDPSKVGYERLLEVFFLNHDPTTSNRQGPDMGSQYRSAVFYHDPKQKEAAAKAIHLLNTSKVFDDPIVTEVTPAGEFYRAEEYHQQYLQKNPHGYCSIRPGSRKISDALK